MQISAASVRAADFGTTVESLQEAYENCIREEKDLEKTFKKEISADADAALVEHTLKLYKQRRPVEADGAADGADVVIQYEELDAVADLPEGMEPGLWGRVVSARKSKIAKEAEVGL